MATKKKLDIHIDFDKEKNEKILNDKIEQEKFINDWKQKLSEKLGVPISDIIITNLRKGSVNFDIFIQNHDNNFQKLTDNIKEVAKLNNANVTNVKVKNLMQAATITPDMFDKKGNRSSGWGINEKRGGHPYIPPIGWSWIESLGCLRWWRQYLVRLSWKKRRMGCCISWNKSSIC